MSNIYKWVCPGAPVLKMNIENHKIKYLPGYVHWDFSCGCTYKGIRYRIMNRRVCQEHRDCCLEVEYKICACGMLFVVGPKQGARKLCEGCIEANRLNHNTRERKRRLIKT